MASGPAKVQLPIMRRSNSEGGGVLGTEFSRSAPMTGDMKVSVDPLHPPSPSFAEPPPTAAAAPAVAAAAAAGAGAAAIATATKTSCPWTTPPSPLLPPPDRRHLPALHPLSPVPPCASQLRSPPPGDAVSTPPPPTPLPPSCETFSPPPHSTVPSPPSPRRMPPSAQSPLPLPPPLALRSSRQLFSDSWPHADKTLQSIWRVLGRNEPSSSSSMEDTENFLTPCPIRGGGSSSATRLPQLPQLPELLLPLIAPLWAETQSAHLPEHALLVQQQKQMLQQQQQQQQQQPPPRVAAITDSLPEHFWHRFPSMACKHPLLLMQPPATLLLPQLPPLPPAGAPTTSLLPPQLTAAAPPLLFSTPPRPRDCVLGGKPRDLLAKYAWTSERLGSGQFGRIRAVVETESGREYACKTICKSHIHTWEEASDIAQEVLCMALLRGRRSVVQLKDALEDQQEVHVVMERCGGGDLCDRLCREGPLTEAEAAAVCADVARALAACHGMGFMHRDVKTENILIVNEGDGDDDDDGDHGDGGNAGPRKDDGTEACAQMGRSVSQALNHVENISSRASHAIDNSSTTSNSTTRNSKGISNSRGSHGTNVSSFVLFLGGAPPTSQGWATGSSKSLTAFTETTRSGKRKREEGSTEVIPGARENCNCSRGQASFQHTSCSGSHRRSAASSCVGSSGLASECARSWAISSGGSSAGSGGGSGSWGSSKHTERAQISEKRRFDHSCRLDSSISSSSSSRVSSSGGGGAGSGGAGEKGGGSGRRALRVKLCDFGLATRFIPGLPCSEYVGTPAYMAPEVAARNYGAEGDVWSLGVVVYACLTRLLPFGLSGPSPGPNCLPRGTAAPSLLLPVQIEQQLLQQLGQQHSLQQNENQQQEQQKHLRQQAPKKRCREVEVATGSGSEGEASMRLCGPGLSHVSEECRDALRRMLCRDPRKRITAQQLLDHPWIRGLAV